MRQFLMFTFLMVSIRTAYAEDNSPAYFGAVSIVVTIMLVLLCIWLLNSHNVTRKVKLSILGVGIGVFGLVQMLLSFGMESYRRSLLPPDDPEVVLAVEEINEQMPLKLTDGMTLRSVDLKDSTVVSTLEIDETKYSFEDFLQNKEQKKRIMMANVAKSSPFKSCSYVDIANKGYSVAMLVKGMQSHREIKFILTPKEVKNAQNQPKPTPREELDLYLNELNKNILVDLEDGLLSAHARIQGQICVVVYTIDENKLDISGFEKSKESMRVELKNEFMVKGDLIKLASLLAPLGMSFRICYVGNLSKKQVSIDISSSYIQEVLDNAVAKIIKSQNKQTE